MAVREILILPDKRLRKVSEPVKKIDAGIRKLVDDMLETMYDAPGIGLAAIQIGTSKRVVTMDLAKKEEPKNPQVFINPEIVWSSDEKAVYEEGCLSIPETYSDVERPAQVKVKYLDLKENRRRSKPMVPFHACSTRSITSTASCSLITFPGPNATHHQS
jgi:peptide deformylase